MAALELQAGRRDPREESLPARGSLLDWGVEPTGRPGPRPIKSVPQQPATESAFRAALADFPTDTTLLVNFGEFLLSVGAKADEIDAVFARAVAADPSRPAAHLGRGIVAFKAKRFPEALAHFRAAEAVAPDAPAVLLNLAVCYEQRADRGAALAYWERTRASTANPALCAAAVLINVALSNEQMNARGAARMYWEQALTATTDPTLRTAIKKQVEQGPQPK